MITKSATPVLIHSHCMGSEFDLPTVLFQGLDVRKFSHYPSRAFVMAGQHDIVILPPTDATKSTADVLPYLNEVGLGPRPENVLFLGGVNGWFDDPNRSLHYLHSTEGKIVPFTGMAKINHTLAKLAGLQVAAPDVDTVRKVNGKDFFQHLCDPDIPEGFVFYELETVQSFFRHNLGYFGKCISKTAHNATGLNAAVITPDGQGTNETLEFFAQDVPGKLVIQKWYDHQTSPSANFDVLPDGTIIPAFISDQFLSVSRDGVPVHEGNVTSNLPRAIQQRMWSIGRRIVRRAWQSGYWGPIGVDFIINLSNGLLKAVEINPRITAPRYAHSVMKKAGADAFCLRNLHFPPQSALSIRQRLDPIFFQPRKKEGVIFFNFTAGLGKVASIALAHCRERAVELSFEAENLLN